tara:strand:+ start:681 stop:848 length:168 start_codon:yes stop_codon:yes gene_type:complete
MAIKKNINWERPCLHLYNPQKEGLGSYDVNYINAYEKKYKLEREGKNMNERRHAA